MVIAVFETGERTINVCNQIWQYNYGQILRIQGLNLPPAVEVHFSLQDTGGASITRIGITKDDVTEVPIPDSMLENEDIANDYSIYAFVYLTDETSGQTEYKIILKVKARPKPEIPGGGDNPDIFHEAVEAVRESMEAAAESERQAEGWAHGREDLPERAQDNAKYYSDQAREDSAKTDADRKEVGRLVESVSGIGEQVEKVEGLTKQAQTSATNAALSEQAAKESENNAAQARVGAEVAEDNAELAAQRVEQDKAIVEQAKNIVKQMGQEILDNKNAVDKTVQDFGITAQQALADVNNAGQAQTERVQTTGTTAVENIQTTQGTAAEAVEAAKSEAVQAIQAEGTTQTGNVTTEGTKQVQAVADKGKEVLQSIPEDFQTQMEAKLDKNQGTENAGKALVVGEDGNVAPGEPQEEGAPPIINSATGNLIVVDDSAGRKKKGLKVFGKSEQVTTTGANLIDAKDAINTNGWHSIEITNLIQPNGIYYAKAKIVNAKTSDTQNQVQIRVDYINNGVTDYVYGTTSANGEITIKFQLADFTSAKIQFKPIKVDFESVDIINIMLSEKDTAYEPYTGGKPSPSPDYPQEIVSKEVREIKVAGSNLIKMDGVEYMQNTIRIGATKGIYLQKGIRYVFTCEGKEPLNGLYFKKLHNKDPEKYVYNSNKIEFTPEESGLYYIELYKSNDISTSYADKARLNIAKDYGYEPYKEQLLTLSEPVILHGIPVKSGGNYTDSTGQQWICDEIDLEKEAYVEHVGKVIADGVKNKFTADSSNRLWNLPNNSTEYGIDNAIFFNRYFSNTTFSSNLNYQFIFTMRERMKNYFSSADELNAFCKQKHDEGNPLVIYYAKEAKEIKLSDEDISTLKSLHTYYPTTVISNNANADMQLDYVADTRNFVLGQIKEIAKKQLVTDALLLERTV